MCTRCSFSNLLFISLRRTLLEKEGLVSYFVGKGIKMPPELRKFFGKEIYPGRKVMKGISICLMANFFYCSFSFSSSFSPLLYQSFSLLGVENGGRKWPFFQEKNSFLYLLLFHPDERTTWKRVSFQYPEQEEQQGVRKRVKTWFIIEYLLFSWQFSSFFFKERIFSHISYQLQSYLEYLMVIFCAVQTEFSKALSQ